MQEQKNHKEVTAETHTPEAIEFMGKKLLGVKVDDEVYVAMKPVVEGMGLVWSSQLQKLNKFRHEYNHVDIDMVAQDGKKRSMTCIPLTKLNGWLFSINKNKVHPDLREKVKFGRLNLSEPSWPIKGPLDIIFCRNVMIYFDNDLRAKLVEKFYSLLGRGGLLFTGHSESLTGMSGDFTKIMPSVYLK